MKDEGRVFLINRALEEPRSYELFFLWQYCILRGRLSPVLIDAVLEVEDCEIPDVLGYRFVEKDGLCDTAVSCGTVTKDEAYSLPAGRKGSPCESTIPSAVGQQPVSRRCWSKTGRLARRAQAPGDSTEQPRPGLQSRSPSPLARRRVSKSAIERDKTVLRMILRVPRHGLQSLVARLRYCGSSSSLVVGW